MSIPSGAGLAQGTAGGGIAGSNPVDVNLPLDGQMSKLLFQLPCSLNDGTCAKSDELHFTIQMSDSEAHSCTLLVRGVVEQSSYVGGKTTKTFLNTDRRDDSL